MRLVSNSASVGNFSEFISQPNVFPYSRLDTYSIVNIWVKKNVNWAQVSAFEQKMYRI